VEILFVLAPLYQTSQLPHSSDFLFFILLEFMLTAMLIGSFIHYNIARCIGFFVPHALFLVVFNPTGTPLTPITMLLHSFTFLVVLMQSLMLTYYRESNLRLAIILYNILFLFVWDYSVWSRVAERETFFSIKVAIINTTIILSFVITRLNRESKFFFFRQRELMDRLRETNEELHTSNEELAASTEELHSANEMLNHLNQNLEKEVALRTRDLAWKNQQLTAYAYLNAHHLRAPLARIMGISNLMKMETDVDVLRHLSYLLDKATSELDDVIHRIQDAINESAADVSDQDAVYSES